MSDPLLDKLDEIINGMGLEVPSVEREILRKELRALLAEVAIEYRYVRHHVSDTPEKIRARFGVAPEQEERR